MAQAQFLIRRKVFKFFGAAFHIYNAQDQVIGYCKQKAFKLKEDIRVYTDETMKTEFLQIHARNIIDFSAAYDVIDGATGERIGVMRRKGWTSMLRDTWELLDPHEQLIGVIQEDSMFAALLRRLLSNLIPQSFHLTNQDGKEVAHFKQNFNPFVYKLGVTIPDGCPYNPLLILGAAVLISAIEGRQS